MSDIDEPPTKMSKYEEYLDPECEEECLEEEGQEEWLSEGVLTDDDYVQTTEHDHDQDKSDTILPTHQEENENNQSLEEDTDIIQTTTVIGQVELHGGSITNATITHGTIAHSNSNLGSVTHGMDNVNENIEEQLNNLENTQNGDELSDDLDAFLISKADGHVVEAKVNSETELLKMKTHEDDGNDTDDLLRMLGDGDQKVKKKTFKMVKSDKNDDQGSSDDDDFIYERSQVKTLKLAKNALIKRTATKAVPEDLSDGDDENDQSSDEGNTVERIFEMKKPPPASGKKPQPKGAVKHVVRVNNKSKKPEQKYKPIFTTQKSNKKSATPTAIQKPQKSEEGKTPTPIKAPEKWTTKEKVLPVVEDSSVVASRNEEFDEIIDGEEFLEEDVTDLDEEEFDEYSEDEGSKKQEIMKPEMMDEEVPSDAETQSEDGSLYDELPSSDSEDLDDWFTLDIRAERAGDYLPLLGIKARDLLIAERRRVSAKVDALRQSLSALTESARRQADQLRSAAMALAEIDDTLRAA